MSETTPTHSESSRNSFIALCELASREDWCWKLSCFCGHSYFRYAFRELASGKHPDDHGWIVKEENHHELLEVLGPIPEELSADEQIVLSQLISESPLKEIRRVGEFPDWLGYLGLGLRYCEEVESKSRQLTRSLVPQFLALLEPPSAAFKRLNLILDQAPSILRWPDLEFVVSALKSSRNLVNRYQSDQSATQLT